MGYSPMRVGVAVVAICAGVAGCGGGGSTAPPPKNALTIEIESFGGTTQVKTTPSINAGVVQMKFTNRAEGKHSAQIVRFDPGHDPLAASNATRAWVRNGRPLPGWIHLDGGFGRARVGQTLPGVGKFVAGSYAVLDLESAGRPVYGTFAAKGGGSDEKLPASPSTVTAVDYSFSARGLRAGASLLFQNRGRQPHRISAALLKTGASASSVAKNPHATVFSSGILDGGASQITTLGLTKAGRYALFSTIPDRTGGKSQALKGMVGQAVVK